MKLWVYIYKNEKGDFKIALTASVDLIISGRQPNMPIVYLRPFEIPFDAVAHKHLLDDLSNKSVLEWVVKHKEETNIWLDVVNKNNIDQL